MAVNTDEILAAFRQYCADRQPPVLSADNRGYLLHCLQKAARNAASRGESPMFALMHVKCGHGELIPDFLMALPRDQDLRADPPNS